MPYKKIIKGGTKHMNTTLFMHPIFSNEAIYGS